MKNLKITDGVVELKIDDFFNADRAVTVIGDSIEEVMGVKANIESMNTLTVIESGVELYKLAFDGVKNFSIIGTHDEKFKMKVYLKDPEIKKTPYDYAYEEDQAKIRELRTALSIILQGKEELDG